MDWIPDFFTNVTVSDKHVQGIVRTEKELESIVEIHRKQFNCSFVFWTDDKSKKEKTQRRVLWSQKHVGMCHSQESEGQIHPFCITNLVVRACQYGKPRPKKAEEEEPDHTYPKGKKLHVQDSRKCDCSAKLYIRRIRRFDNWLLSEEAKRSQRKRIANTVDIENDKDVTEFFCVSLPLEEAHDAHLISKEGGFCQRIKKEVKEKIVSFVSSGITSTPVVKKLLKHYVQEELDHPDGVQPSQFDRAFFPRNRVITNHIHKALVQGRYAALDLQNLERKMQQWQSDDPNVKIHFRKCVESTENLSSEIEDSQESLDEKSKNTFLFVHQTRDQQLLLKRYGDLVLMDATYKTSKYALPLFMLAVPTNVKYLPVAEFVVESESIDNIREALEVIKEWNPDWRPGNFMVDYCNEEIQAIKTVFPKADTYLCAFHREQSWRRWISKSKNGLTKDEQDQLLSKMESMANSQSEGSLQEAREEILTSSLYKDNPRVKSYLDNYWLKNTKNWCEAHLKPGFIGRTKTTNGIESLNKSFKHFHLKLQGNGTISTMIEVLVTDFVPGMMEEYRNLNFMSSTQYKRYNSIIPVYLHNRPREVVTLLLKHIGSAEYSHPADVNELPDGTFEVNSEADDQRWYKVHLGNDREDLWPSCSCPSFTSLRMLCKHFFVIFKHTDKTWDDLSSNFKNSPYLTLDNEFLSDGILSFDFKVEEVETDELDQLIKLMRQQEIEEKRQERKKEELNNHEKMLSKQQASLREKLRLITDLSFDVTELKVIQSVCRSLDSCIDTMENSVKKENDIRVSQDQPVKIERSTAPQIVRNLPLRKGRLKLKKKQKSNKEIKLMEPVEDHQDYQRVPLSISNFSVDPSTIDGPVAQTSEGVSVDVRASYSESQNDLRQASILVDELWGHRKNYDVPVAKVYGQLVTDSDIRSLHGTQWLTDKVIDCYLSMMITAECDEGRKALHIPQSTMNSIMEGSFPINYFKTRNLKLSEVEVIVGSYHRNAHWTLIVVEPINGKVYFYNPMEEQEEEMCVVLQKWHEFASLYSQQTGDSLDHISWQPSRKQHSRQQDGYNCGVYCLLFAEKHLKSQDMIHITVDDLSIARKQIASKIMLFEAFLTDCCPKCGYSIGDEEKIQCERCERNYHFKNYCVFEDINELQDSEHFVCRLCSLNFWPVPLGRSKEIPAGKMQGGSKIQWTTKSEIISLLQKMGNTDSDCQILDTQTGVQKQYSLRTKVPKRKRSSFLYPPLNRGKKRYCICNRTDDGRLYWECESKRHSNTCKRWYHPACVGLKAAEEPKIYICEACSAEDKKASRQLKKRKHDGNREPKQIKLDMTGKQKTKEVTKPKHRRVRLSSNKQTKKVELPNVSDMDILLGLIGEKEEDEEAFFITTREAEQHIEPALEKVKRIVNSSLEKEDIQMQRHRNFLHRRGTEQVKRGYGFAVFSFPALLYIEQQVKKRFYMDKTSKIYSKHGQIVGMKDEALLNAFEENKYLADIYCSQVLCKETMINIFQSVSGATYEEADIECSSTEDKSQAKEAQNGIRMSNEKKMEWTQKRQKMFRK